MKLELVQKVSIKSANEVGDGTTTSTLLTYAILEEGLKHVNAGQNPVEIKPVIIGAVEKWGKLNGFVHLAGRPYVSPLKSINHNTTIEIFNLNTYAAIELAKVFTSKNVYAGEAGSIVIISSVYGLVGSAANLGYAMSKAALHGVTKSLSIELAAKNIRVNCVAPGFVKTKMLDNVSGSFNQVNRSSRFENIAV